MKISVFLLLVTAFCPLAQGDGGGNGIESLITSMKQSFSGLSAKRDLWYENYSKMTELVNEDTKQLQELLTVSKMAIPMIWLLYAGRVMEQKNNLFKIVTQDYAVPLPFTREIPVPRLPYFHVEATLMMAELRDFQVEILRGEDAILIIDVLFSDSRVVMKEALEGEDHEHVVLEEEEFPDFKESNPFTINIQVAEDCVFTSFWLSKLDPLSPMALPTKYHWCTEDYTQANTYTVNIIDKEDSDEDEQQEDDDVILNPIQVVDFTVYDGVLIQ